MDIVYILLAFAVGYIVGRKHGFNHGMKTFNQLLRIPPGNQIDGVYYKKSKR